MGCSNENKVKDDSKSYIIAEFEIKEENVNKDTKIINSFELFQKENELESINNEINNEKEIMEKCQIWINNEAIPFAYYHKFDQAGTYTIKYEFIGKMSKIHYMFHGCESLISIDFSHFDAKNVSNMSFLLSCCESLKNVLGLSVFDSKTITNLAGMFCTCSNLKNINLSNFNTENVTHMEAMFCECKSLTELDLSGFKTKNVINMSLMFDLCKSLTNVNLSGFDTQNVTDMNHMFNDCESLTKIDLSDFNTQKTTNMGGMFRLCKSLTNLNLSHFNLQNIKNNDGIFEGCDALRKENVMAEDQKIFELLEKNH